MKKNVAELATRWLRRDLANLSAAEQHVLKSAVERKAIARDISHKLASESTIGDRLADTIARVGGSWSFIIAFLLFLVAWAALNAWLLGARSFDPYPFIFLNLVLSMIAALQAPIIMMSQNRQAEHDRVDAAHDYEVNLKAEIEIMALHEKLDELRHQEILALREAARKTSNYRLPQATLYVTLEPCVMCCGAIIQARLARVVYGATDPKAGAVQSRYRLLDDAGANHRVDTRGGVLAAECGAILRQFFEDKRSEFR